MENKTNIAELLKNCPKGMELDCTMFENVILIRVDLNRKQFPIEITVGGIHTKYLTKKGCFHDLPESKCVIFPKGKTTWEGFHRPFVEGDIVATESGMCIGIVKSTEDSHHCYTFCSINDIGNFFIDKNFLFSRFATEKEKQKLFDIIKAHGYKWNPENKTLEKLVEPIFKAGDRIGLKCEDIYWDIKTIEGDWYICTNGSKIHIEEQHHYELILIKPNFKVGNKIREKSDKGVTFIISNIDDLCYYCGEYVICNICDQELFELVPNKFDIDALRPFDKVLVRDNNAGRWDISFFSHYNGLETYKYSCINGTEYAQCIPYEGNEYLLNTTGGCNDFYKTWKE